MRLSDLLDPSDALPLAHGLGKEATVYRAVQGVSALGPEGMPPRGSLALLGAGEERGASDPGPALAPDALRRYLYALSGHCLRQPLFDLGNLKPTPKPSQSYAALRQALTLLLEHEVSCVVLGGTQELTLPIYQAYADSFRETNLTIVDRTLDMSRCEGDFGPHCFVNPLMSEPPARLYSTSLIGYQNYLSDAELLSAFQASRNQAVRLGQARDAMDEVEPILRDSDVVSFDMGAVRQGDFPSAPFGSPNGLYAEEACQLARYSAYAIRPKVFGLFGVNPLADTQGLGQHLAAQIAWHFIEGFNHYRPMPKPNAGQEVKRFYVKSPIPRVELVFLKDSASDTWWMELPRKTPTGGQLKLVACSHTDYQRAAQGDVPERWLVASKRLM